MTAADHANTAKGLHAELKLRLNRLYAGANTMKVHRDLGAALDALQAQAETAEERVADRYGEALEERRLRKAAEAERDAAVQVADGFKDQYFAVCQRAEAAEQAAEQAREALTAAEGAYDEEVKACADAEHAAEQAQAALQRLVEWSDKWPSHRVYGGEDIKRVAAEIDEVVDIARAALAGETT